MRRSLTHAARRLLPVFGFAILSLAAVLLVVAFLFGQAAAAALLIGVALVALILLARRLRDTMADASAAQDRLRAAIDNRPDSFYLLSAIRAPDGTIVDFRIEDLNPRGSVLAGMPRDRLLGRALMEALPQYNGSGLFELYCEALATGASVEQEREVLLPGEASRWAYILVVPVADGVAVSARDITARKHAELEMLDNRRFLQSLVEHSPLMVAVRSARAGEASRIVVWNRAAAEISGYAAKDVVGRTLAQAFPPGFPLFEDRADQTLDSERDEELRLERKDGAGRDLHARKVPLFDDVGRIEHVLCIAEDITARRQQDQALRENALALRESEARLRTVADNIPAMIAYIDRTQVYRFHNRGYLPEFDGRNGVLGRTILDAIGPQRYARIRPYVEQALSGQPVSFEDTDERDGLERTMQVNYIPQLAEDGSVAGFHVMRLDITSQKREKKRLIRMAHADPLTGLANRAGFMNKLDEAMQRAATEELEMAVMYLDIDKFKPVNDTYGHAAGDALLKLFAARLRHTLRSTDTIGRLGGDEFTVIIEHLKRRDDAAVAAAKIVTAMQAPFKLDNAIVKVSTSIGLAFYRNEPLGAADLLGKADAMLYKAKQEGRNTYRIAA